MLWQPATEGQLKPLAGGQCGPPAVSTGQAGPWIVCGGQCGPTTVRHNGVGAGHCGGCVFGGESGPTCVQMPTVQSTPPVGQIGCKCVWHCGPVCVQTVAGVGGQCGPACV